MENLWAPWRIKYIESVDNSQGCIFCDKWEENKDKENLILKRGKVVYVIMNLFPYNNGHLMIVPKRHTSQIGDLSDDEKLEMFKLMEMSLSTLQEALNPQGFNMGMNIGRVAGAGIEEHVHLHIVPRWKGDTNFMPIIGDTKVISEGLEETYRRLTEKFK